MDFPWLSKLPNIHSSLLHIKTLPTELCSCACARTQSHQLPEGAVHRLIEHLDRGLSDQSDIWNQKKTPWNPYMKTKHTTHFRSKNHISFKATPEKNKKKTHQSNSLPPLACTKGTLSTTAELTPMSTSARPSESDSQFLGPEKCIGTTTNPSYWTKKYYTTAVFF